ncbi:MAG: mismatch repair protein MutS domain protein [Clostridia bacterium]|jgi:DNA mismatch repair ATPase MutS|nr:mismatch repair protein MutS domain protein [Clostridia bacterium]
MDVFLDELNRLNMLEESLHKKCDTISTLRITSALAGITFIILGMTKENSRYIYVALFFLILFTMFIFWHVRARSEQRHIKCLIEINKSYLDRFNGDWTKFKDQGNEFNDENHAYTSDLDIFGENSLFQLIVCTSTFLGRTYLAKLLKDPDKSITSIKERQGAVKEIASKVDFCREFQCAGRMQGELGSSPNDLIDYAKSRDKLFKHVGQEWLIVFLTMCSIMTAALLIMKVSVPLYIPLVLFILQSVITLLGGKCRIILSKVDGMKRSLETYRSLLDSIRAQEFEDKHLMNLKKELFDGNASAILGLKKLNNIAAATEVKFSSVLYLVLNVILLWDYHCVFELEAWKKQYGEHIDKWLEAIGAFEAYISLAVIPQVNQEYTFPEFHTGDIKFTAKDLGHPLINQKSRITNSIDMKSNICIITGSNMSGKTTMLRTVGINLVLAYAGAPVIAKSLQCSVMDIFTSMRIKDNLSGGISTFYAELLRIKTLIGLSALKKPMIFLLDEIFRGTNSKDRIIGAKSVISTLNKKWIMGMVSTHDFELCHMENEDPTKIRNFHFTEYYVNDEIRFDYKLKSGRCQTSNAKYLMKLAGIELS